jgi:hypothetical protein
MYWVGSEEVNYSAFQLSWIHHSPGYIHIVGVAILVESCPLAGSEAPDLFVSLEKVIFFTGSKCDIKILSFHSCD